MQGVAGDLTRRAGKFYFYGPETCTGSTAATITRPVFQCSPTCGSSRNARVQTLDEMFSLRLLSPEEHHGMAIWIAQARTPEAIRRMSAPLGRVLELSSLLMNADADLTQPLLLSH